MTPPLAPPPAKPPVLLVGNFFSKTVGTRSLVEDLAVRLDPLGWQVVLTSARGGRISRPLDMVTTAWRRRHDYSVAQVDVFSGPAFCWAEAVCSTLTMLGKPYVLILRGGNLPAFAARWPRRVRRLLQSAVQVAAPSRYLQEQMAPYHDGVQLHPNPLDLGLYEFRKRRTLSRSLVWLRAFHQIYNPSLAPRVLDRLRATHPDIGITMFGPDKGDGSLEAMRRTAQELGVDDRITTPGRVPKTGVGAAMQTGDIFLNTTDIDNVPVSVLEAMACGLCVVSTSVGGMPYLLEHERDALLVPPGDPAAMAAAIERLFADPDLAESISVNARRKAEQFDWSVVLPRWQALITGAIEPVKARAS